MKLLLDTHAFLWWDGDAERLPGTLVETLRDPAHDLILSVVSVWEMQIKAALGRLVLRTPLARLIEGQQARNGLQILPVSLEQAPRTGPNPTRRGQARQRSTLERWRGERLCAQPFPGGTTVGTTRPGSDGSAR